jgi:GDSL-like lipase/acylhydrolase family protein
MLDQASSISCARRSRWHTLSSLKVGAAAIALAALTAGCGNSSSNAKSASAGSSSAGASSSTGGTSDYGGGISVDPGAAPDYNPCANQTTPCVIMPLGDSITYGDQSTDQGGWRTRLFHLAVMNKQSITFVGGMMDGPDTVDGVPFPKHHEGHSGYEIGGDHGITSFTTLAVNGYPSQILLLGIGTNDFATMDDPAGAAMRLATLLDLILTTNPNLLLIVAQITPTMDDSINTLIQAYNAAIPGLVSSRAAAGKHIAMVDNYDALASDPNFKTDYLANNLHPNDAGYTKMAEAWYTKIGSLFPAQQ